MSGHFIGTMLKFVMRIFLSILILIFTIQSLTRADDIGEFEIEGMSIGESALEHFTKNQIEKNKYFAYPLKDYFQSYVITTNSDRYDAIQFSIKDGDNDFILESIEGGISPIDFFECKKQKKIIEKEIKEIFPNLKVNYGKEESMWSDTDSKAITTDFYLNTSSFDGGIIRVMCVDRSKRVEKEKGWADSLRVIINSKEFNIFIDKNANLSN